MLNISHNSLRDISGIQNLKNLTHLDASHNQITQCNIDCSKLIDINLSHNQLTDFGTLSLCNNLLPVKIDMRSNRLTYNSFYCLDMPQIIGNGLKLTLDVSHNPIMSLPRYLLKKRYQISLSIDYQPSTIMMVNNILSRSSNIHQLSIFNGVIYVYSNSPV